MAKNGGLITVDDLAQYRAIERRPLAGRYRDHQIYSSPPPVSTGAALIETLQILENYQPRPGATYARDADYLHYVDRVLAGARPGAEDRRPGAVGRQPRAPSRPGACGHALQTNRSEEGVPRSQRAAHRRGTRTDRPRDDGVCRGGCGRQHDCRHADAEHVGRDVLRVRWPGLPLQQPLARSAAGAGQAGSCRSRARRPRACRRSYSKPREHRRASSARRGWRSVPPGTPGFPRPFTTSS